MARRHRDWPTNRPWFWALPTARQHGRRRSTRRLPPRSSPCSMPRFEYRRSNASVHATQRGWNRAVDVHQSRTSLAQIKDGCPQAVLRMRQSQRRAARPPSHATRSYPGYARRHPSRSARGAETRPHDASERRRCVPRRVVSIGFGVEPRAHSVDDLRRRRPRGQLGLDSV